MYKVGDSVLGKYIIDENSDMGGGMADIYFGHNKDLGFKVAIKRLKPKLWDNKAVCNKFKIEAVTQSNIDHQGIVKVIDFDAQNYCMVMEYVQGTTMEQCLDISMQEKVSLFIQAFHALQSAHDLGVIHRDIKPSNIFVTDKGHVKIADFGIAKVIGEDNPEITTLGAGTRSYMSPEQFRGEQVNESSDIYSMGVLMYYLLTGKKPFCGKTPELTSMLHMTSTPPTFTSIGAVGIPSEVEQVVLKCLKKNPKDRYQNCTAVAEALEGLVAKWNTSTPTKKVSPKILGAGILVLVLLAAGTMYLVFGSKETESPVTQTTTQKSNTPIEVEPAPVTKPTTSLETPKTVASDAKSTKMHEPEGVKDVKVIEESRQDEISAPHKPKYIQDLPPTPNAESRYIIVATEGKSVSSGSIVEDHEKALDHARQQALIFAQTTSQKDYRSKLHYKWYSIDFDQNTKNTVLTTTQQGKTMPNGDYIIHAKVAVPFSVRFDSKTIEQYEFSSADGLLMSRVWTDQSTYHNQTDITVHMQGNKDFYGVVAFISSSNDIVLLLPNTNRPASLFKAQTMYAIPSEKDAFSLTVSPPYGTERIVLFSSTSPLGKVTTQDAGNSLQVFNGTLDELRQNLMNIQIVNGKTAEFIESTWVVTTAPQ